MDAGGLIIEVLATKVGTTQPSETDLRAWVTKSDVIVHALLDRAGAPNVTLNAFGIRETAVIVDLRTMAIVKKINGSTAGTPPSSIQQLLAEMLVLVTK